MQVIDNHTSNMVPFESLPDHYLSTRYAHIMPIKCILWAFLCFVGYCIGIPWEGIVYTFLYRATFAYQMATQLAHNIDCMIGMKDYPDKYFDLAICDPPYGINHAEKAGKMAGQQYGNAAARKRMYKSKDWDNQIPDESYFKEIMRVSKNQIVWGGNYMTAYLEAKSGWIVWDKDNGENNFSDCELAWTSFDCGLRMVKVTWNGMIQYDMKTKEDRIHPTQKPIKLYKWLLKNYAKPGDKILDTHLGSGSSRIAAYEMGFDFTGFEIDKDYFEAQEKRFRQHTSQTKLFEPKAA